MPARTADRLQRWAACGTGGDARRDAAVGLYAAVPAGPREHPSIEPRRAPAASAADRAISRSRGLTHFSSSTAGSAPNTSCQTP